MNGLSLRAPASKGDETAVPERPGSGLCLTATKADYVPEGSSRFSSRLCEKRRRLAQYLVRALQFVVLALQIVQALAFLGGQVRTPTVVAFGRRIAGAPPPYNTISRRRVESWPTATGGRERAPGRAGPPAHAVTGSTCWAVPWASSSLGVNPRKSRYDSRCACRRSACGVYRHARLRRGPWRCEPVLRRIEHLGVDDVVVCELYDRFHALRPYAPGPFIVLAIRAPWRPTACGP